MLFSTNTNTFFYICDKTSANLSKVIINYDFNLLNDAMMGPFKYHLIGVRIWVTMAPRGLLTPDKSQRWEEPFLGMVGGKKTTVMCFKFQGRCTTPKADTRWGFFVFPTINHRAEGRTRREKVCTTEGSHTWLVVTN